LTVPRTRQRDYAAPGAGTCRREAALRVGRILLAIAALLTPVLASSASGEPDAQLWTEADVTAPVATDTTITGIGKLRLSESLSNPTLTALEADLNHKVGEWWLSVGYSHQLTPQRPEEDVEGRQVKVTQVVRVFGRRAWKFGRNTLGLRLRLDDTLNASSNPYRARIRLEYRWATEGLSWMSYVFANDEVFYEFQDQQWYRNRFRAGANLVLSERTDLQLFYQRQDSNNSTPGAINALGLTLEVTFK
jgi:hypothetical protein